jgi:hypothetical protein
MPVGRALARYRATAKTLNIPLEDYIAQGEAGKRYCSKCHTWKLRRAFKEYENTKTYYSGICKKCNPAKPAPKGVEKAFWGPAIAAANRIGVTITEYLEKRSQGLRWCVDHKGWFETELTTIRCNPCNKIRQQAFRLKHKKVKKDVSRGMEIIAEETLNA